jgi:hypothetical protein
MQKKMIKTMLIYIHLIHVNKVKTKNIIHYLLTQSLTQTQKKTIMPMTCFLITLYLHLLPIIGIQIVIIKMMKINLSLMLISLSPIIPHLKMKYLIISSNR